MIDYFITNHEKSNSKLFQFLTMPLIDKEYPNSTEMKQLSFNPIIFLVYLVFY
jgi:hypothetical protein